MSKRPTLGAPTPSGPVRKAKPDEPLMRGSRGLPVIIDSVHAGKRHAREPGDPVNAVTPQAAAAAEAKPEGMSRG